MKILEKCNDIKNKIENAISLNSNHDETNELRNRERELESLLRKLDSIKKKIVLFKTQNIFLGNINNLEKVKYNLTKIIEKFNKELSNKSLKTNNYLGNLENEIKIYCESTDKIIEESWKKFCNTSYSGETPEEIKNNVTLTVDKNKNLFYEYEKNYNDFKNKKKYIPNDDAIFQDLVTLGKNLSRIYSEFDRNIPDNVKVFLNAVNSSNGASLDLFTEEVNLWLKSQGMIGNYKIGRK